MSDPADPRPSLPRRAGLGRIVLVSISLLSVLFAAVLVGWPSALALMGVLLLHELGHAAAMIVIGVRRVRIVLLPLGGMTIGGASLQLDPQALVLLGGAGGSLAVGGLGLLVASLSGGVPGATVGAVVLLAAVVNLLNLLPFAPLDGGRLLLRIADGRGAVASVVLRVVLLLLAVAVVVLSRGHALAWAFLAFAVLSLGLFGAVVAVVRRAGGPPEPSAEAAPEASGFWLGAYGVLVLLLVVLAAGAWSVPGAPAAFARLFPL